MRTAKGSLHLSFTGSWLIDSSLLRLSSCHFLSDIDVVSESIERRWLLSHTFCRHRALSLSRSPDTINWNIESKCILARCFSIDFYFAITRAKWNLLALQCGWATVQEEKEQHNVATVVREMRRLLICIARVSWHCSQFRCVLNHATSMLPLWSPFCVLKSNVFQSFRERPGAWQTLPSASLKSSPLKHLIGCHFVCRLLAIHFTDWT